MVADHALLPSTTARPILSTMAKATVRGNGDVARRLDKVEVAILRLAKAQERTEERLTLLAESTERSIQQVTESVLLLARGQERLGEGQERLVEGQERLVEAQRRTSEELIQFGKRMDSFAEQVLRGFTESARRNGDLNAKVEELEKRVEALERAQ